MFEVVWLFRYRRFFIDIFCFKIDIQVVVRGVRISGDLKSELVLNNSCFFIWGGKGLAQGWGSKISDFWRRSFLS